MLYISQHTYSHAFSCAVQTDRRIDQIQQHCIRIVAFDCEHFFFLSANINDTEQSQAKQTEKH